MVSENPPTPSSDLSSLRKRLDEGGAFHRHRRDPHHARRDDPDQRISKCPGRVSRPPSRSCPGHVSDLQQELRPWAPSHPTRSAITAAGQISARTPVSAKPLHGIAVGMRYGDNDVEMLSTGCSRIFLNGGLRKPRLISRKAWRPHSRLWLSWKSL
jgi:hypothetical protein